MKIHHSASIVFNYHNQTKHHFHKYAKSLGFLDWSSQPNPFRFYENCPRISLPFIKDRPTLSASELFSASVAPAKSLTAENLSTLLELSLGLSAWKAIGDSKWSLRINPSSGNLHPTEAYLIIPQLGDLKSGLYHYNPFLHALELRSAYPLTLQNMLFDSNNSSSMFLALTSIFWRESWKYGERAFRYCQHDLGHAIAALRFAAQLFGWKLQIIHNVTDEMLSTFLGFSQTKWVDQEREDVDVLCQILPQNTPHVEDLTLAEWVEQSAKLSYSGYVQALSSKHHSWPIIDEVAKATQNHQTATQIFDYKAYPQYTLSSSNFSATNIICQRRSAQAFDREKSRISKSNFLSCLSATLPHRDCPPFDVELSEPKVHGVIFAHQVEELSPGLYAFVRNPDHLNMLKSQMHPEFIWQLCSEDFPLYLLSEGDYRNTAMHVSCHQDIAGDSAFSLGMIAQFREPISQNPHHYKTLFWECGMIGQALYLQAEAYGLRGTGIGCFFDDVVNEKVCGFKDNSFQSLYHFTVGFPQEDMRLSTLSSYWHLDR